ncbi:MAG: hypothetical protein NT137_01385 [Methanomassiliicoccales archaeon]|nr:hypothetical protein [Methanomassiliicoccales archaeon]
MFSSIWGTCSVSLFDALKVTDNVGLELASLLFFLGLAASAMKPRAWTALGAGAMVLGMLSGMFSLREYSAWAWALSSGHWRRS